MPTYEITSPDGNTYEVTAPEGASQEEVLSYAQGNFQSLSPVVEEEPKYKPTIEDQVIGFQKGLADVATFGFGDELKGGLQGLIRGGLDPNMTIGEATDYFTQKARQEAQQAQERAGIAYGLGQVGGAVLPAAGTAKLLGGAANVIGRGIPAIGAALGAGGAEGYLYGLGSGEGELQERVPQAVPYGVAGGLGGVGGLALSSALKPVAKSAARGARGLADRARKALSGEVSEEVVEDVAGGAISGEPVQTLATVAEEQTSLLPGARTQDVELMRSEELARQGLLGQELEAQVRGADQAFRQSVKNTVQALAGEGTEETAQETLERSIGIVKDRYAKQKAVQSKLMTARNDAIAKAKVYTDQTRDTLGSAMGELKSSPDFVVNLPKEASKGIKEDFTFLEKALSPKAKDVDMGILGAWRSGLNNYKPGTSEGVMAGKMKAVYDDWLDSQFKFAMKEGDEDLADKIFNANKRYAEFKNQYGTNKFTGQKAVIEKILREDEMTPRAMVNTVFGSGLKGKDYTEQYVRRLIDGATEGAERDRVRDGFRAGLYQRAFDLAFEPTTDTINIGKLKNGLVDMMKSDSYKKFLSTPKYDEVTKGLVSDLNKYQRATSDRTIVNLSGTTPMLARFAQGIGSIPILRRMPLTQATSESVSEFVKGGARVKNKRQVEESLAKFYKQFMPEIDDNIKFNFSAPVEGGLLTATQLNGDE